ncbi:MAG: hypothetical protein ACREX3_17060 [Gammaproteobacteria bacterium]
MMRGRGRKRHTCSLCQLIAQITDPRLSLWGDMNTAVLEELAKSRVWALLNPGFLADEPVLGLVKWHGPDGETYLGLYCDLGSARENFPNLSILEVCGDEAIDLAYHDGVGIGLPAPGLGRDQPAVLLPFAVLEATHADTKAWEEIHDRERRHPGPSGMRIISP